MVGTIPLNLLVFFVIALSTCIAKAEPVKAVTGKPIVLRMDGNPTTGYSWLLNEKKSRGLSAIRVRVLGWSDPLSGKNSTAVGESKIFSVEVAPVRPEIVVLVYEYRRIWEEKPAAKQKTFEIRIDD